MRLGGRDSLYVLVFYFEKSDRFSSVGRAVVVRNQSFGIWLASNEGISVGKFLGLRKVWTTVSKNDKILAKLSLSDDLGTFLVLPLAYCRPGGRLGLVGGDALADISLTRFGSIAQISGKDAVCLRAFRCCLWVRPAVIGEIGVKTDYCWTFACLTLYWTQYVKHHCCAFVFNSWLPCS